MYYSLKSLVEEKIQTLLVRRGTPPHLETAPKILSSIYANQSALSFSQLGSFKVYRKTEMGRSNLEPTPSPVAANESGRIWGDPHFEGGDGGKYDVQGKAGKTYNLLSDRGLLLNGHFSAHGKGKTVVGETGLQLSGPSGVTKISVQSRPKKRVTFNGRVMKPGEAVPTADGGRASLDASGKILTVTTGEGYTLEQIIKKSGKQGEMEIKVKTPSQGVARDQHLPTGLLGQTFDGDGLARNSKDSQGKGAIQGKVADYEVAGGVFGFPSPKLMPHPQNLHGFNNFMTEIGLNTSSNIRFPAINPLTLQPINWNQSLQQSRLDSILRESKRITMQQIHGENAKTDRLSRILLMALKSGNISLAMIIFAHLEAKEANQLNRDLVQKMRTMQQHKKQLSQKLTLPQGQEQGQAMGEYQMIKTEIESVNDDISVLQTFIKDVSQNKQHALELANTFLTQEHQTTMSILRSFGR